MFLISMSLFWMKNFLKKVWFVILLGYASKCVKENQRKINISIALSVLMLPILLSVILCSTILSAPLLALFTLPVFIIGFPRPQRIWPSVDLAGKSASSDWVFYHQISPVLLKELQKELYCGVLSRCQPGDFLLARFQDRLIWISILERGLLYHNIVIKGLELQETSCHTAEAESIDDVFNLESYGILNKHFIHTLRPLTEVKLDVYSDARNVLTGIIDNPVFLRNVSSTFPKALLFMLVRCFKERCLLGMDDADSILTNNSDTICQLKNNQLAVISDEPFHVFPFPADQNTNETKFINDDNNDNNDDNDDDDDDEFGDFGFGDSTSDNNVSVGDDDDDVDNDKQLEKTATATGSTKKKRIIDPPQSWVSMIPYKDTDPVISSSSAFDVELYHSIVDSICQKGDTDQIKKDTSLMQSYRLLVRNCYYLVEQAGTSGGSPANEGAGHCYKLFSGRIPWSPKIGWIENNLILKQMILKAYRLVWSSALFLLLLCKRDYLS